MIYDMVIIGGGIKGLCTLYHSLRLGCRSVALVEQFQIGHQKGSSHGQSRITRSSYVSPVYVRLMHRVHSEEWPRLEADTGVRLLHPTPGCIWGPAGGQIQKYAKSVLQAGISVEQIDVRTARRRFPMFHFTNDDLVLDDTTCALIDAQTTIKSLARICVEKGAHLLENETVVELNLKRDPIQVRTNRGVLMTNRLAITAGPWSSQLLPELSRRLSVTNQCVGYFELVGEPNLFQVGQFPVWIYLGLGKNNTFYGLPQFGHEGIKIARHVTTGQTADLDSGTRSSDLAILDLRQFLNRHFQHSIQRFCQAEYCLYTNTETEDYLIDFYPEKSNVVIGAGFSGHGFKLAPLTGKIIAELLICQKTTVPEFEAKSSREIFNWVR